MTPTIALFTSLSFLTAMLLTITSTDPPKTDDDAVREAAGRFYIALNVMFTGDSEPMKAVWSHADDVTYMGPNGGLSVGWEQIEPIWDETAALMLGGKIEATDMQVTVGNDLAFTENFEKGENMDPNGNALPVSIRATNIFRKENGEWKMIGHHTDLLSFLNK